MALIQRETVTFRDAAIIFKNFMGEKRKFNQEGDRNFSILLGEAQAMELQRNRWYVKPLRRREEDDEQLYLLKVAVSFANKPPRCWLVSNIDPATGLGRNKTMIGEGLVGIFDQLEATKIDLTIVAYDWEVSGNSGRKAYLQSFFFTMYEDELEREYSEVQQIAAAGDGAARELESGSLQSYDYEGEVVEEDQR